MFFEIKYNDLAGRIGKLKTKHGIVETPAFIPVIHPVKQDVDISFLKELGFEAIITNAYITLQYYGDDARKRGIHDIVKFDKTIMTDSGGYQVLEYGSVNVKPKDMAKFEMDIKTDIAIPLDKPTGYGLNYQKAFQYVEETIVNVKDTIEIIKQNSNNSSLPFDNQIDNNETNWVGPVQGAEHYDLIEYSADVFDKLGFNFMALGSPVELMEAYEFSTLVKMIATLKKVIPSKPIHLFGAGHPLTIPLAIALGCDTFDSASYMLYAKDDRYMHPNGTSRLDEISYLPCNCQICSRYNIEELLSVNKNDRTALLAKHNLSVLKTEVNSVKQAIMEGRLWEYLMIKAHAHPKLMKAVRTIRDLEYLEYGTQRYKNKAIYFTETIDQFRPEAKFFRKNVSEFKSTKDQLVLCPEACIHPFYTSREFIRMVNRFPQSQICTYNPYLGIIPAEISDLFPASQNLYTISTTNIEEFPTFERSVSDFISKNSFKKTVIFTDEFMEKFMNYDNTHNKILEKLMPEIIKIDLANDN